VLALGVVVDELHRPRPVEGVEGRDLGEALRLHPPQHVLHPRRLELEHAVSVAGREQLVDRRVVEGNALELEAGLLGGADRAHGVVDDGQRPQPQEVHLQQPEGLDVVLVELGAHLALRRADQGHEVDERLRRDHDPGGVHAAVPRETLEAAGGVHEQPHVVVAVDQLAQLRRVLEGLLDGYVELVRDQLRDPVHVPVGHAHHAPDVADRRFRLQDVEGGDLRHRLLAVEPAHVGDHLVPPALAEIDVDIRHRNPVGIEESLEQEVVLERVDIRDAERVGNQRPGRRAAARADRYSGLLGVTNEVPNHQEIARETHLADDLELVFDPRLVVLDGMAPDTRLLEPALQPFVRLLGEKRLEIGMIRKTVFRQVKRVGIEAYVAA
jgi:hypothetical protein